LTEGDEGAEGSGKLGGKAGGENRERRGRRGGLAGSRKKAEAGGGSFLWKGAVGPYPGPRCQSARGKTAYYAGKKRNAVPMELLESGTGSQGGKKRVGVHTKKATLRQTFTTTTDGTTGEVKKGGVVNEERGVVPAGKKGHFGVPRERGKIKPSVNWKKPGRDLIEILDAWKKRGKKKNRQPNRSQEKGGGNSPVMTSSSEGVSGTGGRKRCHYRLSAGGHMGESLYVGTAF